MQLNLRVLSCSNIPRPEELVPIDPYVTFNLSFSKISQQTRVIDNSFDPVWKQDFKISIDPKLVSFGIDISLRSRDAFNEDFEIGSVTGIVEDLKPYEVRNESFKINIIDIDKEKREADSASRQISPFHLFTPRFLSNVDNSNTDQTKDSTDNDKPNNNQNGTFLAFIFQIAPKNHPPFEKEGAPPIPYEPPKYSDSNRKANSGFFMQPPIGGPPYYSRGPYERWMNRIDRANTTFPFKSSYDIQNRRQLAKIHDPTNATNFRNSIRINTTTNDDDLSGPHNLNAAALSYRQKQRSRRKNNDSLFNFSNANDSKPYRSSLRSRNTGINAEEVNYDSFIPGTSSSPSPSPSTRIPGSGSGYSSYSDYNSFVGNAYSQNSSKLQTSSNTRSFDATKHMHSQNSPPSTSISNISQYGKNYPQAVPKAFGIFDRTRKSKDFNEFIPSAPNIDSVLNKPKKIIPNSNSTRLQDQGLQEFHDIFIRDNAKKKKGEKRYLAASENPTTNSKTQITQNNPILNKPQKKGDRNTTPSEKNNSPSYDFSNLLNNDDGNDSFYGTNGSLDYNNPNIYSESSHDDDYDENGLFDLRNTFRINGSSSDGTLSDDDDDDDENDYSEMEDYDYGSFSRRQQYTPESNRLNRFNRSNNVRKPLSSSQPAIGSSKNYLPSQYEDDDQSDSDDVIEIVSPNFNEDKPKPQKKVNYQTFQQYPATAAPPPQIKLSTNSAVPYKQKQITPLNDGKPNVEDDSNKKGKRDIRFFFNSNDDNPNPTGNINFVYNDDKPHQTENIKNSEKAAQSNGNLAENIGPLIHHYNAQKKGNSKKQKKSDGPQKDI